MKSQLYKYLNNTIKTKLDAVDNLILESTKSDIISVSSAIHNLLRGKKIRAILSLISFVLCKKTDTQDKSDIIAAAAIELIHNATLLHDDVVDENSMRRGEQNARSLFGNKVSVLSGDLILSIAFNLIIECKNIEAVGLLSKTALELSQGEIKQLDLCGKIINEDEYLQIISTKTAILFSAGCEIAAILTGQAKYKQPLADFGYNLGLAFQIIDDILDYTGGEEIGKQVGNDFNDSKFTLPCIIAYNNSTSKEEKLFWEQSFFSDTKNFSNAMDYMKATKAVELCTKKAKWYIDLASNSLSVFEDSECKKMLQNFLLMILYRSY